jgi:CDP-diacylglycerol--glycerol-3-phosphate 3-phosphatidyltransferase
VVVALGGSLLVSYTRARGESLGVLCKLGVMQRAERMLLLGLGSILDPALSARAGWNEGAIVAIVVAVIAVGTVWTSVYRTIWIARALKGR